MRVRAASLRRLGRWMMLLFLLAWSAAGAGAQEAVVHVVQWGETLSLIAACYGSSVEALMAANRLADPDTLYAGQVLTIPAAEAAGPGETSHQVRWGESLSTIAAAYDTTLGELMARNGLNNPNLVYAGQQLIIPAPPPSDPPAPETPAEPGSRPALKEIRVDLSEQQLYAYQGGRLVYRFVVSTGTAGAPTLPGEYQVLNKLPIAYSSRWAIEMPYWLGIYWAGSSQNGIHGFPVNAWGVELWTGYLGRPATFGCVMLDTAEMARLYDWAELGTPVLIQW